MFGVDAGDTATDNNAGSVLALEDDPVASAVELKGVRDAGKKILAGAQVLRFPHVACSHSPNSHLFAVIDADTIIHAIFQTASPPFGGLDTPSIAPFESDATTWYNYKEAWAYILPSVDIDPAFGQRDNWYHLFAPH